MIGIYMFKNKINNKVYIGQSINIEKRFREHLNDHTNEKYKGFNTKFYRALRKYGISNFEFSIIEETINLNERERYWIEFYNSFHNGYNSNCGGENVTENNENHPLSKLTNEDVLSIKEALKETSISQYELASKYGVTQSEISNINTGSKWSNLGDYAYPIRKQAGKTGEDSHRTVLTNDIVIEIRNRYVSESGKSIYKDYTNLCSYTTFERALTGRTFPNLPIYLKKEKKWTNI